MFLLASASTVNAQITKGRSMLGLQFRAYAGHDDSHSQNIHGVTYDSYSNSSSLFSALNYGYMFTNHIMLGISAGYSYTDMHSASSGGSFYASKLNANTYSAGLFARYYQRIRESRFYLITNLSGKYNQGKTTRHEYSSTPGKSTSSNNAVYVDLTPGITFMATNKVALETYIGNIGFNSVSGNNLDGSVKKSGRQNSFNSDLFLDFSSIIISINFYFGGKSSS